MIVKVISLLVPEILVLVLLVVLVVVVVVEEVVVGVAVAVAVAVAMMDGWMLGKCCLFGVSDLFLTCF